MTQIKLTRKNYEHQMAYKEQKQDTVAYEMKNNFAWVKFNRPEKRNCMNSKLNRQILRVLDALEYRDDVGVLVLTDEDHQGRNPTRYVHDL